MTIWWFSLFRLTLQTKQNTIQLFFPKRKLSDVTNKSTQTKEIVKQLNAEFYVPMCPPILELSESPPTPTPPVSSNSIASIDFIATVFSLCFPKRKIKFNPNKAYLPVYYFVFHLIKCRLSPQQNQQGNTQGVSIYCFSLNWHYRKVTLKLLFETNKALISKLQFVQTVFFRK